MKHCKGRTGSSEPVFSFARLKYTVSGSLKIQDNG